ncbi:MAG: hypothetical protein EBR01_09505 [Proteobacteria bacterium]|nr:hypothetical protein [Pseudomonadota bacterium]
MRTSPGRSISIFLILTLSFLFYIYRFKPKAIFNDTALTDSYQMLMRSISSGGHVKFQENKQALKSRIASVLKNPKNEDEENHAVNIALYLFPEILPDTNFEKELAIELWGTFENAIEKRPRTSEARMKFEEMKSNIWNYENPRLTNVGLSFHAEETLKLYHELSLP